VREAEYNKVLPKRLSASQYKMTVF